MVQLHKLYRYAAITLAVALSSAVCQGATSVTIVGPQALQNELVSVATTTFNATITASTFFPGSYTITLTSKKPPVVCNQAPVCDLDKDIALMVANSTFTYVYGFANGMDKERDNDLNIVGVAYSACSSTPVSCTQALSDVSHTIYMQNLSTPTIISVP